VSDDETLHQLVRLLSHDLLNTAQAVLFSAMDIEKNWHQGEQVRESGTRLVKLAKAQVEMIRCARETYQAHQAQKELPSRIRPVDLGEAVNVALSLFVEGIRAKDLRVSSSIPRGVHFVEAEPQTLAHQVIANLLSNAIKFTPRGKRIELRVEEEGGTVVLAVADQGIGLKSEWIDASNTETESRPGTEGEPGTGFGLLQVRQYVKAFGGRVEVTSGQPGDGDPGRGTTFRILLRKVFPRRLASARRRAQGQ
jgi:signal transduction histidine kinase